jgi:hypothetical protein
VAFWSTKTVAWPESVPLWFACIFDNPLNLTLIRGRESLNATSSNKPHIKVKDQVNKRTFELVSKPALRTDVSHKTMNKRPTTLHLPGHLPFPVTITSLLVKPDSEIKKHDGLFVYKFLATVSEDRDGEEDTPVRKEMVEQFDSPWEGILTEWHITEGTVVSSSRFGFVPLKLLLTGASEPIVSVIEPCLHEISFKDICAICGADLSVYVPSPLCLNHTAEILDEIIPVMYLHSLIYPCLMITLMLK